MLSTISILSMLLVGCGNSEKKEETPAKTEEQIKDEAKEAAKKELKEEAKKEEEAAKKEEEAKAALKEEIKEEIKEEAKKEEAAKKPAKKAAPSEKTFNTRVSVEELPLKGRKARFEAAAKSTLTKIAGKAGYKNMKGGLSFQGPKPTCKGGKCIWKVSGTFTK